MYFTCVYMYIHVYIGMYYLFWCMIVHTYIYLHILLVFIGASLDCVLYFEVPYDCIVIYISFLYILRSSGTNVMKIHNSALFYFIL